MARRRDYYDNYDDMLDESEQHTTGWEYFLLTAPAWLGSIAVHLIILLILTQIAWMLNQPSLPEVQADIEEVAEQLDEPEPPEDPEIPVNPEALVEAPDPTEEAPLPFSDIDADFDEAPGVPSDDPTDQMPLAIPRLALGKGGAARYLPGQFGHRGGRGRRRSLLRGGGTPGSEAAVDRGLWWLAKVQEPDGSWDCQKWGGGANGRVAVTSLALLAFLGAGHSDQEGKFQKNVTMACKFLAKSMNDQGQMQHNSRMYGQGMAAMALSEAYGMGRTKWVGRAAQKALNFIIRHQPHGGGFNYTVGSGNRQDTSISGWCFMALKSGRICGLDVPDSAFEKMRRYVRTIYQSNGTSVYVVGNNSGTPATSAIGLFCRIFLGFKKNDPMVSKAADYVDRTGVQLGNLYYTYYATLSMFQVGGQKWRKWNKNFRDPLINRQVGQGDAKLGGSWPPNTTWSRHGGRVYSTAMSILALEVYYRFLPLYRAE